MVVRRSGARGRRLGGSGFLVRAVGECRTRAFRLPCRCRAPTAAVRGPLLVSPCRPCRPCRSGRRPVRRSSLPARAHRLDRLAARRLARVRIALVRTDVGAVIGVRTARANGRVVVADVPGRDVHADRVECAVRRRPGPGPGARWRRRVRLRRPRSHNCGGRDQLEAGAAQLPPAGAATRASVRPATPAGSGAEPSSSSRCFDLREVLIFGVVFVHARQSIGRAAGIRAGHKWCTFSGTSAHCGSRHEEELRPNVTKVSVQGVSETVRRSIALLEPGRPITRADGGKVKQFVPQAAHDERRTTSRTRRARRSHRSR